MMKSPSIGHNLLLSQVLVAVSSIVLVGALWFYSENSHYQKEVSALRDSHLAAQRTLIKGEVEKVADYIKYQKAQVRKRLENSIKNRVYEAHAIAKNIYEQNKGEKPPAEIRKMIKDALRPIRFNQGRGYYFITNLHGIEELFADRPEMEGKNMLAAPGSLEAKVVGAMIALVRTSGEAFYEYTWTKPHMEGENHPKIAFVKLFQEYNWLIGTGEYLDEVEKDVQQETVSRIEQISFGESGYIFATTWDGVGISGPGKGINTLDIVDANGLKIVQKMIDISKHGGGYISYIMPSIDGRKSAHKLSYVIGISDWRWYIGAGIYTDEIEETIEYITKDIIQTGREFIFKILLIVVCVTLLAYITSRFTARRTRSNISTLISYFRQASVELRPIDPDLMKYAEFEELAGSVNCMVDARSRMEDALRVAVEISSTAGEAFFQRLVQGLAEGLGFRHAFVGLIQGKTSKIQTLAAWLNGGHVDNFEYNLEGAPCAKVVKKGFCHFSQGVQRQFREDQALSRLGIESYFGICLYDSQGAPIGLLVVMDNQPKEVEETRMVEFLLRILSTRASAELDRRNAELALRQEKEFSDAVIDCLPGTFGLLDAQGHFLRWNKNQEDVTGLSREQMRQIHLLELFQEEDQALVAGKMREVLEHGEVKAEARLRGHDGQVRPFLITGRRMDIGGNAFVVGSGIDISERIQTEEALRASEATLKSIFRVAPIGIGLVVNRVLKQVNQRLCDMLGYAREELIDKSARILYRSQEEFDWVGREKYQQIQEFGTGTVETRWRHKDGRLLDVLLSSTPLNPNDLSAGVTFTALDITERKQAEVALRDERDRAQQYFDLAGVMLVAVGKDHAVSLINKKGCEILGYEEEEIVGKNWFDHFLPERMRGEVKSVFDALMNGNIEPMEFYENPVVKKSGKERIIAWHNTILTDEAGNAMATFSSGEDITERKLAEKERDRLFNLSLDMLSIAGFDGYLRQVNPAWNRILGWTEEELLSKPWIGFIHPDDREATVLVGRQLAAGVPVYFFENRYQCKDGSYRWISWNALPLPEEELILAVAHDSTDQRKLESQLRQAQKMEAIGTLAGGIAHDFNNILSAILGYAEILTLFYIEKDNPARSNLEEILKAANRAKDLVKQILTFSRQTEQEKRPVLLAPIVKEAVRFLRSSLPTTIDIRQNMQCKEDSVLADPTQMHQVVMNLCTNAAHAMKERSGVLEIKLEEIELELKARERFLDLAPGPYMQLTVADNGHGMGPEVLERIFDPYFTTKKQGEGTGLGLAVVHGIVTNHGGVIEVASEVNQGTTFQVLLPRLKREGTTAGDEAERALPLGNECILFIDDEETIIDVGKRILENLGYDVLGVTDPSEALETFRLQPDRFDLVITDLTMPHMTGLQLAEQLTLIKRDIPIILCTGLGDKNTRKEARTKGIKKFVYKPISVYKLAETVRGVLNERL
jgi:PAS domain S-box-containing protein